MPVQYTCFDYKVFLFFFGFPEVDTLFGSYFESLSEKLDLWAMQGYRYELWCLARAAGILYCLVFFETFPFFSDKDFTYSEESFCTVQMFLTQYMDFPLLAIVSLSSV